MNFSKIDSPCITQTICKVLNQSQCGKNLLAYAINLITLQDFSCYCTFINKVVKVYILINIKLADIIYSFLTRILSKFNKVMADCFYKYFIQIIELLQG